ncbi:glycosyltransferase family 2 protein [Hymenobacter negativus]|uniref:Glycosyltransferase family 2 protein n=1 Tax=Hymenobacter negativus TaxID=2795026 RepID=A0ABS0Q4N5_9BACT|nr:MULTISPECIES: glycosyltransferase family 2 protein [Bacteria]MBH8557631.1 glycosyltransferase family 2 protein [Hymenobacter negativus]MBH8567839.1 glycosyltransferase family 2 protein [Hymenobacter negativus]MBR7207575.1 glycosyltransferase family 2 protein [Microvirga sp. STS02]
MDGAPQYSVVVPTYRGQDTIRPLTQQLRAFFDGAGLTFEVIFVNDNGPDQSWQVMQALQRELGANLVKIVRLARNFGQHNALICGFAHARGRFIITMDEDLQHSPADIGRLIATQAQGNFDVVYGKYETLQHSGFRNVTSMLLKKLLRVSIPDLHPDYTAFRLIRTSIARHCLQMSNSYTFLDGYLTWITNNVASVVVTHGERAAGESSYTVRKLIEHSINIFVTFSDLPIRIFSLTSVGIFFLTTCYALYVLVRKLLFNDLSAGFATLAILLGFGVGLILLGIGILGEYIHRINLKTTRRPIFVEAETENE